MPPRDGRISIAVLGAGIAGLVAAYELEQLGYDVVVLEADSRIGGRVFTRRFGGSDGPIAEFGAMRIPANHHFTMRYVDELGLRHRLRPFRNILSDPHNYLRIGSQLVRVQNAATPLIRDTERHVGESSYRLDMAPFRHNDRVDLGAAFRAYPELRAACSSRLESFLDDLIRESSTDMLTLTGGMAQLADGFASRVRGPIYTGPRSSGAWTSGSRDDRKRNHMSELNAEEFYSLIIDNIEDPYPIYRRFREADGLHCVLRPGTGREPEWLVMRYEDAATVLTGRGFGRRAAVPGLTPAAVSATIIGQDYPVLSALVENWLVFMDPPRHTTVRAVAADCLAKRMGAGLREQTQEIVDELVAGLAEQPRIELVSEYAAVVPMLVNLEALGVPQSDWKWMCGQTAALQQGTSFRPGNRERRFAIAEEAARALDKYFRKALSARREEPRDDLMSTLLTAEWHDATGTDDLLVGTCVHLLAAGNETTRNALSKDVLLLLRHSNVLDQLLEAPELVPAAVDELIRFDPPAQMVTRWAYRDEHVGDHNIRRGDKVTTVLGSANRDPARFAAPDTIRFDRPNRQHSGFGMGIHYCLGSALGRMEVEIGLSAMLKLLPSLRVDSDPVPYGNDLIFHGPQELQLVQS